MPSVRYLHGALDLETGDRAGSGALRDGRVVDLRVEGKNRAKELIEDFMIAANGVSAAFLEKRGLPALRRVVRSPERWSVSAAAADLGDHLPPSPIPALEGVPHPRKADPSVFPDLSLTVVKLMGAGEYAL